MTPREFHVARAGRREHDMRCEDLLAEIGAALLAPYASRTQRPRASDLLGRLTLAEQAKVRGMVDGREDGSA